MKTRFTSFLALLLAALSSSLHAQQVNPEIGFAITIGGPVNQQGNAIAADNDGNYFIGGHFLGGIVLGEDEYTSNGVQDAFIAKFDSQGEFVWGLPFGGIGAEETHAVATDPQGNCYVTGQIGSPGIVILDQTLPNGSGYDVFVLKFSPTGELLWWRTYGGTSNDIGRSIAVTADGNVSVAGSFQGVMEVGETALVSSALIDSFVFQLDAQGTPLWATQISGPNFVEARGLAVNAEGQTYVTGDFLGGAVSAGDFNANGFGTYDVFLVQLDSDGSVLNLQAFGSNQDDSGLALAIDLDGNVFMTGYFEESVDFGNVIAQSNGNHDMLLVKFDASLEVLWARSVGGPGIDKAFALDTDDQGNSYFTGLLAGSVNIGGFELEAGGSLLAKLNPEGVYEWAFTFSDTNTGNGGRGLVIDPQGGINVIGNFFPSFEVGGVEVPSSEQRDIYFIHINGVTVVNIGEHDGTSLLVYPNPTTDRFVIEGLKPNTALQLINNSGQSVWHSNAQGTRQSVEVAHLPAGSYILRVDDGRSIETVKLLVQH